MTDEPRRGPRTFGIERSGGGVERAVDEQIRFHVDMTVRALVAAGMSPDDAPRNHAAFRGCLGRREHTLGAMSESLWGPALGPTVPRSLRHGGRRQPRKRRDPLRALSL